jgi:hypothetical protein
LVDGYHDADYVWAGTILVVLSSDVPATSVVMNEIAGSLVSALTPALSRKKRARVISPVGESRCQNSTNERRK